MAVLPLLGIGATTAGTGAAAAGAATGFGTALTTIGAGLSAYSAYSQASAANRAAKFNAQAAESEAAQTLEQGQKEEAKKRLETRQLIGAQRAALAASGADVGAGTAIDIQTGSQKIGDMDAMTIRQNALNRSNSLRTQAQAYNASRTNPLLAGVTSFVGSAASAYNQRSARRYNSFNRNNMV